MAAHERPFMFVLNRVAGATASVSGRSQSRLDSMSFDALTPAPHTGTVFFDRQELNLILRVYGRMVAEGEWRDYAIDGSGEAAVFSVFRRASEQPLYRIEKRPALARRQGAWAVIGAGGHVLKRGRDLPQVLRLFDRKRFTVVD
jgi:hypothetical protein